MKKIKTTREAEELKNQLARALADYDNLRKRVERESQEVIKLASITFFTRLLPVIDTLYLAYDHLKDDGLKQILSQLEKILEEERIVKITINQGDTYDANLEEVVDIEEVKDKDNKGKIAEVLLNGWMMKDGPVIRPAKVKVYGDQV